MKYINQLDYPDIPYITRTKLEGEEREKGLHITMRSSGCGLCASAMVADMLLPDCDFDIMKALELSYESKANESIGTSFVHYVPAFCEKLGLDYQMTDSVDDLRDCFATGGAAIALVCGNTGKRVGLFTHKTHYIVLIGFERDGRVAVLDPSYKEGKYDEEGRKGKVEMKHGVIALCDINEVVLDRIEGKNIFYLFWRK